MKPFLSALKFVSAFQGKKDARYYLNGVNFEFGEGKLTLVATCGTMLGVAEVEYGGVLRGRWMVPANDVKLILAALAQVAGATRTNGTVRVRGRGVDELSGRQVLAEILRRDTGAATLAQGAGDVAFLSSGPANLTIGQVSIECPDWRFVDYMRVIPAGAPDGDPTQHFDAGLLSTALKAIGPLAPTYKGNPAVTLKFFKNRGVLIEAGQTARAVVMGMTP